MRLFRGTGPTLRNCFARTKLQSFRDALLCVVQESYLFVGRYASIEACSCTRDRKHDPYRFSNRPKCCHPQQAMPPPVQAVSLCRHAARIARERLPFNQCRKPSAFVAPRKPDTAAVLSPSHHPISTLAPLVASSGAAVPGASFFATFFQPRSGCLPRRSGSCSIVLVPVVAPRMQHSVEMPQPNTAFEPTLVSRARARWGAAQHER
jgi:hypothetical protein